MSGTLSAGTVSIGVRSNTKGFGASLHKSLMGEIGGIGKVLGGTLMAGIGLAISGVSAVVGVGLKEAMGAEKINAQFAAGIKSTGNAAHLNIKTMDELAASIAGYSGQSYESIGNTEKILQTFTNIKNTKVNKAFDQATEAAANMAAKLGGDASQQAIRLGIALQAPEKGVAKLMRVGVAFTDAQKLSIKTMVKHGDVAGAQGVILKELSTEFGGAAKAAGQTLVGQLARSKVAFGELSKGVMEGVLPVLTPLVQDVAAGFTKAAPKIKVFGEAFTEYVKKGIEVVTPIIKDLYQTFVVPLVHFITGSAIPALQNFAKGFHDGAGPGGEFRNVIRDIASFFTEKLIPAVKRAYETVLPALMGLFKSVTSTMNDHKDVINFVKVAFGVLGDLLTSILLPVLANVAKFLYMVLGPAFRLIVTILGSVVIPAIKIVIAAFLGFFGVILDGAAKAFGWIPGIGPKLQAASKEFNAFRDRTNAALNGIHDKVVNVSITAKTVGQLASTYASQVPHHASGTDNWRGGPTWVNERGGEIIDLPSGSRIIPADKSAKMMTGKDFDYARMAAAMSRAQIVLDGKNVARSVDQRLAPR